MNRSIARIAAAGVACAGLSLAGCHKDSHEAPDYGVTINSIPGLPEDFIKGADVSMLAQLEASGAKFYDESGKQGDALQILKEHGVNWVRLRIWNQPVIAHDFVTDGFTVHAGESAGGINDATRDTALAKRAKALGMKVLLDFHYSDWWADPGKQWVPQAWEVLDLAGLETAIHDYTAQVLTGMKAAGAEPDMVQIGNETNDGFLWPLGRVSANGYEGFAALLSRAAAAVRETDPSIRIMIHLANGGDNTLYRGMFSHLIALGVDFDVIGLSYYPYWHGPIGDLQANLADVSQYFNKPVVVAETAYAWTLDDADGEKNNFGATQEALGGFQATAQGQASFLRELMAVVADVPDRRGLGVFYWEPDWIAVQGAGWYTNGGDGWDNQTLFDHAGKALPSMNVFRAVSEERPWVEPAIASIPALNLSVPKGTVPTLPASVSAIYDDGSIRPLYVVWDPVDPAAWDTVGTFDVAGTVVGSSLPATLHALVYVNLLQNAGFETGDLTGWSLTGADAGAANVKNSAPDAHAGTYSVSYWKGTAFTFTLEQTVAGLDPGSTYTFSFWASGLAGSALQGFATCNGVTQTVAVLNTGWGGGGNWNSYSIGGLSGAGGSCTVGVIASSAANDWGNLDDFQLHPEL
jgi:arabinogalactan endo-1,4-beta-galactosidase